MRAHWGWILTGNGITRVWWVVNPFCPHPLETYRKRCHQQVSEWFPTADMLYANERCRSFHRKKGLVRAWYWNPIILIDDLFAFCGGDLKHTSLELTIFFFKKSECDVWKLVREILYTSNRNNSKIPKWMLIILYDNLNEVFKLISVYTNNNNKIINILK